MPTYMKCRSLKENITRLKTVMQAMKRCLKYIKKYLIAAKNVALVSKTQNYYEYASKHYYYRTDTPAQREKLRKYTKEYIIPLYKEIAVKSKIFDNNLSSKEYSLSDKYLKGKYDSFDENYLFDYFSSLPTSSGKKMKDAFKKDRVLIGDKENSYDTAMLYMVGNTPICYFHQDKATLDTMAHELGHYYAHLTDEKVNYSYDLKEVHSTANTMLLYSYLSEELDSRAFTGAELYMVSNWLYQIISNVIRDEFDEIICTSDPLTLTLEDFNRITNDLIDKYGVRNISSNLVNQVNTYWRRGGITYPMKNYSYATAMITSFQIYIKSKDDYTAASKIYKK